MASQADVHRIALSLPATEEAPIGHEEGCAAAEAGCQYQFRCRADRWDSRRRDRRHAHDSRARRGCQRDAHLQTGARSELL